MFLMYNRVFSLLLPSIPIPNKNTTSHLCEPTCWSILATICQMSNHLYNHTLQNPPCISRMQQWLIIICTPLWILWWSKKNQLLPQFHSHIMKLTVCQVIVPLFTNVKSRPICDLPKYKGAHKVIGFLSHFQIRI